jgi:hypothetical protein
MKKWEKESSFANGVIYASGNERKFVLPNCPDIYFELDKKTVRWYPGSPINNPVTIKKA